ncbi:MAG: hypothetical protein GY865_14730 [candidate division Zixibacteria bacterium]|nr:hypothetical protein [candidate division Zixibacteria bacterium]
MNTLNNSGYHPVYLPVTIIFAILAIFTHRTNIRRLFKGDENRFSFHSRSSSEVKDHG